MGASSDVVGFVREQPGDVVCAQQVTRGADRESRIRIPKGRPILRSGYPACGQVAWSSTLITLDVASLILATIRPRSRVGVKPCIDATCMVH